MMASTSGSFEMNLSKFDNSNFYFWKKKIQDYLVVKAQIDPIENDTMQANYQADNQKKVDCVARGGMGHNSDASLRVGLLDHVKYSQ